MWNTTPHSGGVTQDRIDWATFTVTTPLSHEGNLDIYTPNPEQSLIPRNGRIGTLHHIVQQR